MTMGHRVHVLRVDPIACDGHGICAELLPEWIRLDDWGYPIVRAEAVPPELLAHARWAVSNCPVLALHLESRRAGPADIPPTGSRVRS
ncbi:MAG TPA: ferredoxin [Acidimicrobiales bacterium]|nr:ferredoxin [Acidimicrobiales bacterium]